MRKQPSRGPLGDRTPKPTGILLTWTGPSLPAPEPRIAAFIWGGKVRPRPMLPFGNRK